jgi:hypothetical protein
MQTLSIEAMLNHSIGVFMGSRELSRLPESERPDDVVAWLQCEQTAETLEEIGKNANWLDTLAEQLAQVKQSLETTALSAELRLSEGDPGFKQSTCKDMQDCLISAYGIKPSTSDIGPAYFAVFIRNSANSEVISAAIADFRPYPANEFTTRMECVATEWQRKKVAGKLFGFIESSIRFLSKADGFVCMNTAGLAPHEGLTIRSFVDGDAQGWHKEMMMKFGFEEEGQEEEDDDEWRGDDDDVEFVKKVLLLQ